jgi:hypothetical protein
MRLIMLKTKHEAAVPTNHLNPNMGARGGLFVAASINKPQINTFYIFKIYIQEYAVVH